MNKLIQRLTIVFKPPRDTDPKAYFAEIDKLVSSYSEAELDKAADLLIRDGSKSWPSPRDICVACADARSMLQPEPPKPKGYGGPDWHLRPEMACFQFISSELGRQAAKEGWILGLYAFYSANRKAPDAREIGDLKANGHLNDAEHARVQGMHGGLGGMLKKLSDNILKRRDTYSAVAMGDMKLARKLCKLKAVPHTHISNRIVGEARQA